jgi:hypothetical protein
MFGIGISCQFTDIAATISSFEADQLLSWIVVGDISRNEIRKGKV